MHCSAKNSLSVCACLCILLVPSFARAHCIPRERVHLWGEELAVAAAAWGPDLPRAAAAAQCATHITHLRFGGVTPCLLVLWSPHCLSRFSRCAEAAGLLFVLSASAPIVTRCVLYRRTWQGVSSRVACPGARLLPCCRFWLCGQGEGEFLAPPHPLPAAVWSTHHFVFGGIRFMFVSNVVYAL